MKFLLRIFKDTYFFFPVQLLLENLRRNHTLIFFWLLLFLYITKALGFKYGIYALFLTPEYLGQVGSLSYLIMGFTVGIFIMAYHIATYIINGNRFPALATFSRPFFRFSLNNFLIPVGFVVTYIVLSIRFQHHSQLFSTSQVVVNILFFIFGMSLFYLVTFSYFALVNRGMENLISLSRGKLGRWRITRPLQKILERDLLWKQVTTPPHNVGIPRIGLYLNRPFQVKRAPVRVHLSKDEIQSILRRNHTFATVFSIIILTGLLVVGALIDRPVFNIPAASSIVLVFTIALLLYTVFHTFFKEYALWIFLALLLLIVYILNHGLITKEGRAYGLKYTEGPVELNTRYVPSPAVIHEDKKATVQILERWKSKVSTRSSKPVMVIVNTSGGGLKAALWTYHALSYADSVLGGALYPRIELITGASGGMVGAAYLRELYYMKSRGIIPAVKNDTVFARLADDMLNPIALYLALKDWFINFNNFTYNHFIYRKDRGWALEEKLNLNTNFILDKPLASYKEPEEEALVPMMFLTPTILNDGRLLVISPLRTRYMMQPSEIANLNPFIEFREVFASFDAGHLRFTSALRMNASFPFISPVVTLPGEPKLKITDAGFRDNFGCVTSLRFLYLFSDWINQNTSGVVFLSISQDVSEKTLRTSAFDFLRPVEGIYQDYFFIQKYNHLNLLEYARKQLSVPLEVVHLDLNEREERISLSWHLTNREKENIKASVFSDNNRKELKRLGRLLKVE